MILLGFGIGFFIGLIVGAKIQKNMKKYDEWARNQLRVVGVPV